MKPVSRTWMKLPREDEVEVMKILVDLSRLIERREIVSGYSFKWGKTKKRSVLVQSPEMTPENVVKVNEKIGDRKSPLSTLCFLPTGSGSDGGCSGGGDRKQPVTAETATVKRKVMIPASVLSF